MAEKSPVVAKGTLPTAPVSVDEEFEALARYWAGQQVVALVLGDGEAEKFRRGVNGAMRLTQHAVEERVWRYRVIRMLMRAEWNAGYPEAPRWRRPGPYREPRPVSLLTARTIQRAEQENRAWRGTIPARVNWLAS